MPAWILNTLPERFWFTESVCWKDQPCLQEVLRERSALPAGSSQQVCSHCRRRVDDGNPRCSKGGSRQRLFEIASIFQEKAPVQHTESLAVDANCTGRYEKRAIRPSFATCHSCRRYWTAHATSEMFIKNHPSIAKCILRPDHNLNSYLIL